MLPRDAPDRRLDVDGTIARSIAAAQAWLALRTGGLQLKVRSIPDHPALFHRSRRSGAEWLGLGDHPLYAIEEELRGVGWDTSKSLLGVYFDGPNAGACGDGISPEKGHKGRIFALYLSAAWPERRPCRSIPLGGTDGRPGYWEFIFLHEAVHALGFVTDCAPHFATLGHVSDSPADLLYRGPLVWEPDALDTNNDDYFRHGNQACPDLADSPYLQPARAHRDARALNPR
ncbi:MAG: hypothetical protein FJZ01_17015 [Candidatus Sericytochromatia bacterium]|nr:hypothetical protein [Candidatus Tanganyikabacteria bacterium]